MFFGRCCTGFAWALHACFAGFSMFILVELLLASQLVIQFTLVCIGMT